LALDNVSIDTHPMSTFGQLFPKYSKGTIMKRHHQLSILAFALLQASCGGGGGGGGSSAGASVSGTVPGTLIEAFGDNGSYYAADSKDNGTNQHPFKLNVPVGVGFELVMTTGEGTPEEVVHPIGFRDSTGTVRTRLMLGNKENIDLGHIPLYMSKNDAAADDLDDDGVLDQPMVLDDVGAQNPLAQADADGDNVDDWNDPDHGGYQYDNSTTNPQDVDNDGIPNVYDKDYSPGSEDTDGDGLPDSVDANPHNDRDSRNDGLSDDCDRDGYNDDDQNHDGFHDDDSNRDGYHDDDMNHDGHHDGDGSGTCSSSTTTTTTEVTTTTTTGATTTTTGATTTTTGATTTTTGATTTTTGATTTTTGATTTTTGATTTTTTTTPATTTTTTMPSASPGQMLYDAACSGCHSAGSYDPSGFANLAGKGGSVVSDLSTISGGMINGNPNNSIDLRTLTQQQVNDLAAFLNSL
jgi:hypothetical protein